MLKPEMSKRQHLHSGLNKMTSEHAFVDVLNNSVLSPSRTTHRIVSWLSQKDKGMQMRKIFTDAIRCKFNKRRQLKRESLNKQPLFHINERSLIRPNSGEARSALASGQEEQ